MGFSVYNGSHQWINFSTYLGNGRAWVSVHRERVSELEIKFKSKSVQEIVCYSGPFSFSNVLPKSSKKNRKCEISCTVEVFETLHFRKFQHGALRIFLTTLCQPCDGSLCKVGGMCRQLPLRTWGAQQGCLAAQANVLLNQELRELWFFGGLPKEQGNDILAEQVPELSVSKTDVRWTC